LIITLYRIDKVVEDLYSVWRDL